MDSKTVITSGVILLVVMTGLAFAPNIMQGISEIGKIFNPPSPDDTPPPIVIDLPPGTESNTFSFTPYSMDTDTALTGATVRVWYDNNNNGKMEYNEIGRVTEASGTYTSVNEYVIGSDYPFWVQIQKTTHQTEYAKLCMTGNANSDGSAKTANLLTGSLDVITTDDSVTYAGLIRNVAWDDGTDYNYTASGTDGTAKVITTLSAADKGLSDQLWHGVDYMAIYSGVSNDAQKSSDYWIKWNEIDADGVQKWYAPDFFGIIMSEQDSIDFGIKIADFDGHYLSDPTNNYYWQYTSKFIDWSDYFYKTSDTAAAEGTVSFTCEITAAGTTLATTGVTFWHNLEYGDWLSGSWGSSAANYIGTPGSGWAWVVG